MLENGNWTCAYCNQQLFTCSLQNISFNLQFQLIKKILWGSWIFEERWKFFRRTYPHIKLLSGTIQGHCNLPLAHCTSRKYFTSIQETIQGHCTLRVAFCRKYFELDTCCFKLDSNASWSADVYIMNYLKVLPGILLLLFNCFDFYFLTIFNCCFLLTFCH